MRLLVLGQFRVQRIFDIVPQLLPSPLPSPLGPSPILGEGPGVRVISGRLTQIHPVPGHFRASPVTALSKRSRPQRRRSYGERRR